jgi:hypothetical protein
MRVAILVQLAPVNRVSRCFAHSAHAQKAKPFGGNRTAEALRHHALRGGLRDYRAESPAAGMAAALPIILVMASSRLGAGQACYGLALCGRPPPVWLVLLVLLVLRMADGLQELGMTLLHFGNSPVKMPRTARIAARKPWKFPSGGCCGSAFPPRSSS